MIRLYIYIYICIRLLGLLVRLPFPSARVVSCKSIGYGGCSLASVRTSTRLHGMQVGSGSHLHSVPHTGGHSLGGCNHGAFSRHV